MLDACIQEVNVCVLSQGLSQEGIYRLSGVKSKIEMLKELYNQGELSSLKPVLFLLFTKQILLEFETASSCVFHLFCNRKKR